MAGFIAFLLIVLGMAPQGHALTNSFTTVTETFGEVGNAFDWGLTIGLGIAAVALLIGWVKLGLRSATGSKKT